MTELQIGDRIRDNDPRMRGRVLPVIAINGHYVIAGRARIRVDRIHTDGRPRKSGFDLLQREL